MRAPAGIVTSVTAARSGEILPGLWRFEATHPEWTEEEGGEDGWDPLVAWWATSTSRGLLLIDPLVADWDALDALLEAAGGCAGTLRTCHWHERSIAQVAARYGTELWSARVPPGTTGASEPDHALQDGDELWDGIHAFAMERADELALWLPAQRALVFGDAMLRRGGGELRVCPDSWTQPDGGPARLRTVLRALEALGAEHVLVSHGPLVLGDGLASLQVAAG